MNLIKMGQIGDNQKQNSLTTRVKLFKKIPVVGVEPTLQKEHDFESCASANSATPARL